MKQVPLEDIVGIIHGFYIFILYKYHGIITLGVQCTSVWNYAEFSKTFVLQEVSFYSL